MLDIDGDIIKYIIDTAKYFATLKSKSPANDVGFSGSNLPEEQDIYQSPIKGVWYNSGDFSPGKATDSRHKSGHDGIDMRAPGGTKLYPMCDGVVTYVGTDPKGGNVVNISHNNKVRTYYAHLGTISVQKNQKVDKNTEIGTVGESGNAKGTVPHCHFQVWVDGKISNPSNFFSVPKYTSVSKEEQRWLPGKKEVADNWSLKSHLQSNKIASKLIL